MCEWLLLCFSRNKLFPEILSSGEYKKSWFLKTRFSCFETQFVQGLSIVPVSSRHATLLLSLPNLSRKIEGPLLAGYKLINNNNFKDRSFQRYLTLDILTNPVRLTLTKKGNISGKNPLPVLLFTYYSLKLNCPFSKKLASHNFMQNKDDKVGYKTANKQERQRKKREQERKIEIDSQKEVEILAFAHAWKTKKLFNYIRLVEKHAIFSLQNSFLAFLMLISCKPVQRRGTGEKCVFSLLDGRHQRVNKVTDLF